mmetsp:Transcript_16200/g.56576  ORF Transcript_16200/g.56576 Transcript_16200/m.56576 type:complete len:343 (+) Transcript_16200:1312-2340(+)
MHELAPAHAAHQEPRVEPRHCAVQPHVGPQLPTAAQLRGQRRRAAAPLRHRRHHQRVVAALRADVPRRVLLPQTRRGLSQEGRLPGPAQVVARGALAVPRIQRAAARLRAAHQRLVPLRQRLPEAVPVSRARGPRADGRLHRGRARVSAAAAHRDRREPAALHPPGRPQPAVVHCDDERRAGHRARLRPNARGERVQPQRRDEEDGGVHALHAAALAWPLPHVRRARRVPGPVPVPHHVVPAGHLQRHLHAAAPVLRAAAPRCTAGGLHQPRVDGRGGRGHRVRLFAVRHQQVRQRALRRAGARVQDAALQAGQDGKVARQLHDEPPELGGAARDARHAGAA